MKLGSLFDGSGGFPLAGSLCGIEPVWASEVEPYPVAVTTSRFPNMKHLGSVTDINGAEIEPVDIITFGSPCQDLSVAGKRAGLKHEGNGDEETTRSGLFMEAIRIIKEMRSKTNGAYPTFAVWENVPGAFSSNKGEDFRVVLEEFIKVIEPSAVMPDVPKGGWAYADSYRGDGWSLGYRVFDAQYWGVPQRRRRIYLVADFRGQRAREILFEREGLRGYFAEGGAPWQAAPADAERGIGADDRERILNSLPFDTTQVTSPQNGNNPKWGDPCHPLAAQGHPPTVICEMDAVGVDCYNQALTGEVSATLGVNCGMSTGRNGVIESVPYTLKIRSGCEGGGKGALIQEDKSATPATNNDQYLFQPVEQYLFENHSQDTRYKGPLGVCPMLPAQLGTGGNNTPFVVEKPVYPLEGNGARPSHLGDGYSESDKMYTLNTIERHAVAYGEPIAIDRAAFNQGQNAQYEPQFYTDGTVSTLVAKGPSAVAYKKVRYIVRRLTPTECARLQGFADRWGDIEEKTDFSDAEYTFWLDVRNTHAAINGKAVKEYTKAQMLKWYNGLHTDSAEYKMWGNGVALPCPLYVMQGIKEAANEVL